MKKHKVIKCLDGKERVFFFKNEGEQVQYRIWKDGKPYGKGNLFSSSLGYPKFVTKEMVFGEE